MDRGLLLAALDRIGPSARTADRIYLAARHPR